MLSAWLTVKRLCDCRETLIADAPGRPQLTTAVRLCVQAILYQEFTAEKKKYEQQMSKQAQELQDLQVTRRPPLASERR